MPLRAQLAALADGFANAVLAAIRGASLEDLLAEGGAATRRGPGRPRAGSTTSKKARAGGRLARRSSEDIAEALSKVVALVKGHKTGLRSEQIRDALKLDKRELPRVLHEGIAKKVLRAKGQKRATTYSAGGGGSAGAAPRKKTGAKRAAKK